jgi:hypothetical protein
MSESAPKSGRPVVPLPKAAEPIAPEAQAESQATELREPTVPAGPGGAGDLSSLDPDKPLDLELLSKLLNRHPKTIERHVRSGEFPPPFTFMGRRCWTARVVVDFIRDRQQRALQDWQKKQRRGA